jgi:hypothetical protein
VSSRFTGAACRSLDPRLRMVSTYRRPHAAADIKMLEMT